MISLYSIRKYLKRTSLTEEVLWLKIQEVKKSFQFQGGKMEIYFVTTNLGKVNSLQKDLGGHEGIKLIHRPLDLSEPRSSDVQEIAGVKIREAYSNIHAPTIVIDAGFYVHSLNGFPRAFVNFALETVGLEGILKLAEGKKRECEFRECLAYLDKELSEPKFFMAYVKGVLSFEKKGMMQKHLWSELGLIFMPEGSPKTLAEMSYEEYLNWRISSKKNSLGKQACEWISANRNL